MKAKYLGFGILLGAGITTLLPTCTEHTTYEQLPAAIAQKLLDEADSILHSDTLFWTQVFTTKKAHSARQDELIQQKMDSAIQLCPHSKEAYLRKYQYLMACRKVDQLLPVLQEMDNHCDSLQGDLLALKGLLEYHCGDSLSGKESLLRADRDFQLQLDRCQPSDSLLYGTLRISRALNLSFLKNDFHILQNELKIFQDVYPQIDTNSLNSLDTLKSREDYYRLLLPEQ